MFNAKEWAALITRVQGCVCSYLTDPSSLDGETTEIEVTLEAHVTLH